MPDPNDHGWLKQGSTSSTEVRQSYEDWAGSYDKDLADWDYRAPLEAARLLGPHIASAETILDAGCGTGLVGAALRHVGYAGDIDGIDLSPASLEEARARGTYRHLRAADFQNLPLAIADDAYDVLTCVGVLTYVPDSDGILREFARILRPQGVAIVTQRDDLFEERAFGQTIQALVAQRIFSHAAVTEPKPYLPANPDFGSDIRVVYALLTMA